MRLTMQEKRTISKVWAGQYRRASKKAKGRILDGFVEATGCNRVYAARLLRHHGKHAHLKPGGTKLRASGVAENLIIHAPCVSGNAEGPDVGTWESAAGLILAVIEIVSTPLPVASQELGGQVVHLAP